MGGGSGAGRAASGARVAWVGEEGWLPRVGELPRGRGCPPPVPTPGGRGHADLMGQMFCSNAKPGRQFVAQRNSPSAGKVLPGGERGTPSALPAQQGVLAPSPEGGMTTCPWAENGRTHGRTHGSPSTQGAVTRPERGRQSHHPPRGGPEDVTPSETASQPGQMLQESTPARPLASADPQRQDSGWGQGGGGVSSGDRGWVGRGKRDVLEMTVGTVLEQCERAGLTPAPRALGDIHGGFTRHILHHHVLK